MESQALRAEHAHALRIHMQFRPVDESQATAQYMEFD